MFVSGRGGVIVHKFLKSIGFSKFNKKRELNVLIEQIVKQPDKKLVYRNEDGSTFAELSKSFGDLIGLAVRGEYNEENVFETDYFYPYFQGSVVSTSEHVDVERHAEKESYAGVCDEIKIGVTLIFYLQNVIEYLGRKESMPCLSYHLNPATTTLAALSSNGKILLPIQKTEQEMKYKDDDRYHLITAARDGDEDAIESLTLEDIDTYSMISRRIMYEDVLTIVSSYFMPYGIESDQYSILGEIQDFHYIENKMTHEQLCILNVVCNDLTFDVCINRDDLLGEPAVGRRFKGDIWMQGNINYEN